MRSATAAETAKSFTNSIGMKMVLLPPGEYTMGRTEEQFDKVLEIVLYFLVGALTGWLVERETKARKALEASLMRGSPS